MRQQQRLEQQNDRPQHRHHARPEEDHRQTDAGRMRAAAGHRRDLQRRKNKNKRPAEGQQHLLIALFLNDTPQAHQAVPQAG